MMGRLMRGVEGRNTKRSVAVAAIATSLVLASTVRADDEWASYGRDPGGQRFSPLTEISTANVARLKPAWTFHTGDIADGRNGPRSGFETTPLYLEGKLFLTTPFNRIIALDPTTGAQLWAFDPQIDRSRNYGDGLINRGLAAWHDPRQPVETCGIRLFEATLDARLVALDAHTGKPCTDFGSNGEVSLTDVKDFAAGTYHMTSPPVVVDGVVVVGSAINDNGRATMPSGAVRGYDARTGKLRWTWDPIPSDLARQSGAANAWSIIVADPARHLVFVPTGSASPDYYGGLRPGDNRWANSIVALDVRNGRLVWGFQLVHHDLWDYDTASPPLLADIPVAGRRRAAVIVASKTGYLYILDRATGLPLFPVHERRVPASAAPGEAASLTQPVPRDLQGLVRQSLSPENVFGQSDADRAWCRAQVEAASAHTVFAPPSLAGIVAVPGNIGGINWSGFSFDPRRNLLLVNTSNLPFLVRLIPRENLITAARGNLRGEVAPQRGTPFGMARSPFFAPSGVPCAPPPWGELIAVDLAKRTIQWREPLGTMLELSPVLDRPEYGSIGLGGSITTAGGLTFVGGTVDRKFRAFDTATGALLWSAELPASAHATPMTYSAGGRQFVVIAAGGSAKITEERQSDAVVAYSLPKRSDAQ